ncbi:MAG: hypothetical protein IH628_14955 [Proteobacteria bacterium]|nr:hypothetical protein [Pseudomonadota bacterium]
MDRADVLMKEQKERALKALQDYLAKNGQPSVAAGKTKKNAGARRYARRW